MNYKLRLLFVVILHKSIILVYLTNGAYVQHLYTGLKMIYIMLKHCLSIHLLVCPCASVITFCFYEITLSFAPKMTALPTHMTPYNACLGSALVSVYCSHCCCYCCYCYFQTVMYAVVAGA